MLNTSQTWKHQGVYAHEIKGPYRSTVDGSGRLITANSWDDRIIEWLGLEDTLKIIKFHRQGHLPPDQDAQSPIQPGPEHLQGWGTHDLSGN